MAVICKCFFRLSRILFYCCLWPVVLAACQSNGNNTSGVVVNDSEQFAFLKHSLEENARRQEEILKQLAHLLSENDEIAFNVKAIKIQVEAQQTQLLALSKKLASLNKVITPYSTDGQKVPGQQQLLEQILLAMDALKMSLGQLETEQAALYQKLIGKPSKLFYLCRPPRCEQDYESNLNISR